MGVALFILGAVLGSFTCCQAWRSHKPVKSRWSVCLKCKYRLKWYDNIPILSWVLLRGRCRKCGKGIGWWELLAEIGMGVVFVVFGWWLMDGFSWCWETTEVVRYVLLSLLLLAVLVGMGVLLICDARWGRLPVLYLTFCVICAILFATTREWGVFDGAQIWDYLGALLVLPVLYYLLYKVSKEKWVGSGDWLLVLPMALVLGDVWLAFCCLFLANILGSLVGVPMMIAQKKNTNMRIAFGPFLIGAFVVVFLLQGWLLELI